MKKYYCQSAIGFAVGALALVTGLSAQAACPTASTQFKVYQADINGDGAPDLLFTPVPTVIMLPLGDDDELIPLVTDPGLPAFNYLSSAAPATVGGIPANTVRVSYQSTVMPGDAAGCGMVILRAQTPGLPSLVGAFSATPGVAPTLVQVLNSAANTSRKISYTYDARNRLVSTTYGDGSPGITRSYTADGLLNSITTGGSLPSTWTYSYNNRRLLTTETLTVPGVTSTIQRTYNANGHLTQFTYPNGPSVDYAPDALGAPTKVGNFASNVTWAPNGRLASFRYANGVVHSVDQNVRGLPWHANDTGPTTGVIQDTYTYDEEANIQAISDGLPGNVASRTMAYDGLDRLTAANSPGVWGNASFGYDPLDNLRSSTVGGRSSTHVYDGSNRLVQVNTNGAPTNYGYDPQGNLTSKINQASSQAFLFDIGNRLIASGSNGYAYDGHGRRTLAYGAGGQQRVQMYSHDGQLLWGTYKPSASAAASGMRYVYLAGKIIAEFSSATEVRYLHTDGLGSPVARTDSSGALIDRTRYEPYGATAAGTNPGIGADNIGFTGHANDPATGLVYMQQRYYDPIAGRFLSVDPVTTDANTGGHVGRYHYGNNNPYRYLDPDGGETACKGSEECAPVLRELAADQKRMNRLAWDRAVGAGDIEGMQEALDEYTGLSGASSWIIAARYSALLRALVDSDRLQSGVRIHAAGAAAAFQMGMSGLAGNAPSGIGKLSFATDKAGNQIGRIVVDSKGNALIEPVGGRTVAAGKGNVDTHTLYPNGSNYQRLNPQGHANNSTPHGHGHASGAGPGMRGQGASLDPHGNVVPANSSAAHWPIN